MNATWSYVLSLLSGLLDTIVGDPVHTKLGTAVKSTLSAAEAAADGASIDPQPIADHLAAITNTGRTATPEELDHLHEVAKATLNGEAIPAVPAPSGAIPVLTAAPAASAHPRKTVSPTK